MIRARLQVAFDLVPMLNRTKLICELKVTLLLSLAVKLNELSYTILVYSIEIIK